MDILHNTNIVISNEANLDIPNTTKIQRSILANRIKDKHIEYLEPSLDIMKDLYKLKDIDKAAELLAEHITNKKRIALVFDYDCDGLNSGAVLTLGLRKLFNLKDNKDFIAIPNRRRDGNGFNNTLCERIFLEDKKNKIDLIVTSDHASSDEAVIPQFLNKKIKFLLTDHHYIPKDNYPKSATVFVNNQRSDSEYDNGVSGCFVAFLLIVATYDKLYTVKDERIFDFLLPYVALTTISDVMPLDRPINRAMVQYGMYELNSNRSIVWSLIKEKLGISTAVNSVEIGFKIAPLINTASRVGVEDIAYNLLVAEKERDILIYIKELLRFSKFRKLEQKKLLKKAITQINSLPYKNTIALALESKIAVGGVIAAQVGESFNKPTVCFIKDEYGNLTGSMRAVIPNIHLLDVLNNMANEDDSVFIKFGGHKEAAGATIKLEKIDRFRELFDKHVYEYTKDRKIDTNLYVDAYLEPEEIEPSIIKEISRLEPYGKQWSEPRFVSLLDIKYYNIYGSMCRFVFKLPGYRELEAIYFLNKDSKYSKKELDDKIRNGDSVLVVYKLGMNNFNKKTTIQLNIIDIQKIEG